MGATSPSEKIPAVARSGADRLARFLKELGVPRGFGVTGGAIAPFAQALGREHIPVVHCRHESGAMFAAIEAYFASHRPQVVFVTTGPGLTNALTGLAAAWWEGAKVLLVSGVTSASHRGRWAFQETSDFTFLRTARGGFPDFEQVLEDPAELVVLRRRLENGFSRPGGFAAHVALPVTLQTALVESSDESRPHQLSVPTPSGSDIERCAAMLSRDRFGIWLGHGARRASDLVRELARRTGAPVLSTPRAKGIFPESDAQFLGVSGFAGDDSLGKQVEQRKLEHMLVLGTRLGELSSFWDPALVPPGGLIHVDLDPRVFGAAYPDAPTWGIQSEIGEFLRALLPELPELDPAPKTPSGMRLGAPRPVPAPAARDGVRPTLLMAAIQRVIVERSDAIVMTEAGTSFAWGTRCLRFSEPGRYRVSVGFGSMGQATAGVVGAALGSGRAAVAIVGDGAMLMNSEVGTAVAHGVPAIWIVLNDARYSMIEQGMRAQGWEPIATRMPVTDFVLVARGMGAQALRVEHEGELDRALEQALAARGPFVIDVRIDPRERAPIGRRIQHLIEQGAGTSS